jgi:succinate dehydrogenase / fumarate reductase cytochrome b subunit
MAQAGSSKGNRPIAPHLMDGARLHWRWGPGMLASILHRVSGVAATVGLALVLWWLGALLAGADAYASFANLFWGPNDWHVLLKIVVIGCTWGLFAHALTGLRHFVLDTGAGYELDTNNFWAAATVVGGVILTAVFWAAVLLL